MTLGKLVKAARKDKKLSLAKLGLLMGVSRQLVWQWEHDESDPRKHIEDLSRHLERPVEYFYGTEPPPLGLCAKIDRLSDAHRELVEGIVDNMLRQLDEGQQKQQRAAP